VSNFPGQTKCIDQSSLLEALGKQKTSEKRRGGAMSRRTTGKRRETLRAGEGKKNNQ